jgi:hypothetical protein
MWAWASFSYATINFEENERMKQQISVVRVYYNIEIVQ